MAASVMQPQDPTAFFIKLQTFYDAIQNGCPGIFKINPFDFIVVCNLRGYLYQYSSADSTWSKLLRLRRFHRTGVSTATFDEVLKRIFVAVLREGGTTDRLMTYNLTTGEQTESKRLDIPIESMVLIGGKIHMFYIQLNRNRTLHHYIFDIESGALVDEHSTSVTSLSVEFGIDVKETRFCDWAHQTIFCKSRESILIGCGVGIYRTRSSRSVLIEYSLNTRQYRRLEWSVNPGFMGRAMVSTLDERYIVVFGGVLNSGSDHISVYDLKEKRAAVVRDIKCPNYMAYGAVVLGSKEMDELVAFAFVRDSVNSSDFKNVQEIPIHLIQLMSTWYSNEKVHLVEIRYGSHWQIDMDKIIQSFHAWNAKNV